MKLLLASKIYICLAFAIASSVSGQRLIKSGPTALLPVTGTVSTDSNLLTPELPKQTLQCKLPTMPFLYLTTCVSSCPITQPYYDSFKVCSSCPTYARFYNSLDNTCRSSCPESAPRYDNSNFLCVQCPSTTPYYHSSDNTCKQCPVSAPLYDIAEKRCTTTCTGNSWLKLDSSCVSPAGCPTQNIIEISSKEKLMSLNGMNGVCRPETISKVFSTKFERIIFPGTYNYEECEEEYFYKVGGKCGYCPPNSFLSGTICIKQCGDNKCKCPIGQKYVPFSRKCVITCPEDNPLLIDGNCLQCPPPLFSVNGKCVYLNNTGANGVSGTNLREKGVLGSCPQNSVVYDVKARTCRKFCDVSTPCYNATTRTCSESCENCGYFNSMTGKCVTVDSHCPFATSYIKKDMGKIIFIHPSACNSTIEILPFENYNSFLLPLECVPKQSSYGSILFASHNTPKEECINKGNHYFNGDCYTCPAGVAFDEQKGACKLCPPETPLHGGGLFGCLPCPKGTKYVFGENICAPTCPDSRPLMIGDFCMNCPHSFAYNKGCYITCPPEAPYYHSVNGAAVCTQKCPSGLNSIVRTIHPRRNDKILQCVSACPSEMIYELPDGVCTKCDPYRKEFNNILHSNNPIRFPFNQCGCDLANPILTEKILQNNIHITCESCPKDTFYDQLKKICVNSCEYGYFIPDYYNTTTQSYSRVCKLY